MITVLSEQWDRLSSSDPNRLSKEIIEYVGLSTDEKPTELIVTGSTFLEADTGDVYMFSEETSEWFKMLSVSGESGGGSSELPSVTAADNGDVLTVVNGQWDKAEPQGGSELPEVTSADNGKVLTVVEGQWDKAEAGSSLNPIIITIGADEATLSNTGQITLFIESSRMADIHDQLVAAATNNTPVYLDLTFTTNDHPGSSTHISGYATTSVNVFDNSDVYVNLICDAIGTGGDPSVLRIHAYEYQSSKMIIMSIGGQF